MKRTPLKRKTGLKRGQGLKRSEVSLKRTPLKWVSAKKAAKDAEWRKVRAAVLRRDGHRCRARQDDCRGAATQVHHVRRRSQGGSDKRSNLLSVCDSCHGWIHANPAKAHTLGLLARAGDELA